MNAVPDRVRFTRRQLGLLLALTLMWGLNWPMMKLGVGEMPPLSFRALSLALGLPMLYAMARAFGVSLAVARSDWRELVKLTTTNLLLWQLLLIVSLPSLSSGRAAILGYTMPIFSALWGIALYRERLVPRQWLGVAAAALGVTLLLWHEMGMVASSPWAALGMLTAAACWGLGTQQLRRTTLSIPTLALAWWTTALTTVAMCVVAWWFESARWAPLSTRAWVPVLYNAVLIFGMAQPIWLLIARSVPPAASTLSVMMIPVLGTVSGALWLREALHWQDGVALLLMGVALGSVLWPGRSDPVAPAQASADSSGAPPPSA